MVWRLGKGYAVDVERRSGRHGLDGDFRSADRTVDQVTVFDGRKHQNVLKQTLHKGTEEQERFSIPVPAACRLASREADKELWKKRDPRYTTRGLVGAEEAAHPPAHDRRDCGGYGNGIRRRLAKAPWQWRDL